MHTCTKASCVHTHVNAALRHQLERSSPEGLVSSVQLSLPNFRDWDRLKAPLWCLYILGDYLDTVFPISCFFSILCLRLHNISATELHHLTGAYKTNCHSYWAFVIFFFNGSYYGFRGLCEGTHHRAWSFFPLGFIHLPSYFKIRPCPCWTGKAVPPLSVSFRVCASVPGTYQDIVPRGSSHSPRNILKKHDFSMICIYLYWIYIYISTSQKWDHMIDIPL